MKINFCLTVALIGFPLFLFAQINKNQTVLMPTSSKVVSSKQELPKGYEAIKWEPVRVETPSEGNEKHFLLFEGAVYYPESKDLPVHVSLVPVNSGKSIKASIIDARYEPLSPAELEGIEGFDQLTNSIKVNSQNLISAKQEYVRLSFVPLRKNALTGEVEKVVSYKLRTIPTNSANAKAATPVGFASHSVLATGNWFKIAVEQDGVYSISYEDMEALGMDVDGLDPRKIGLYGNGGGMVPVVNGDPRPDDLIENAIRVIGEEDGSFDQGDKIIFYGQGPHQWVESDGLSCLDFEHRTHLYSTATYYFLTASFGSGKRIGTLVNADNPANTIVTSFDDHQFFEDDRVNLLKSGRDWFGDVFDITTEQAFSFSFNDRIVSEPIKLDAKILARSIGAASSFNFDINGTDAFTVTPSTVSGEYYQKFAEQGGNCQEIAVASSNLAIGVSFQKGVSNAQGWLDNASVNVRRNLKLNAGQILFRDLDSRAIGNISEFRLSNSSNNARVWEVTDPTNVKWVNSTFSGNTTTFKLATSELREFAAYDGSSFLSVETIGSVGNQDLHGLPQVNMVVIAHPDFIIEAERLADFHRSSVKRPLSVHVVTPVQIYNEYSSGAQDVSAIRDFMRMFYERAGSDANQIARYLLMFGDASYDYKDILDGNTNFVPTFESHESLLPTRSYASDDYFGMLDPTEGNWTASNTGALDIGVGRFPVRTLEDAKGVVDKIYRYEEVNAAGSSIGGQDNCVAGTANIAAPDWRNRIVVIADDEDGNMHFNQADDIADTIQARYPDYNIIKIYLDSYIQESTPGGQRYPEAQVAINNNMQKGALLVNYTGHGGELGWTHERVLGLSDINSWTNSSNLPAFVTATCEFSRYDDPARVSAGEQVLLNPVGGGIALFTTSRLVYSAPNFTLNMNFYKKLFTMQPWGDPTMGDVIRMTKVASGSDVNNRNFSLLGDPAQRLAYPEHKVVTTSINGVPVGSFSDTLNALELVTVSGKLVNSVTGNEMTDFNGVLFPTVYDKAATVTTLGNDPSSYASPFKSQKNLVFKGKASVINGNFTFQFVVPKDIAYNYDVGRFSYYAENEVTNANGYSNNFYIGGASNNAVADNNGPEVSLYMNDESFAYGGTTDENPLLLAVVLDSNGINTVGNGIGHDLTAVLDDNSGNTINLNDFYQSDLDSYQSGRISYPFSELSEGVHNLKVKVWDVHNNSSESYTEFVVAPSAQLALDHVLNYPNPFTTHTAFMFEHNQACSNLDVQVQVFTVSGKLVKTINENVHYDGFRGDPIEWNGLDDYGQKIGRGVYIYNLKVSTPDGQVAEQLEKLVILN